MNRDFNYLQGKESNAQVAVCKQRQGRHWSDGEGRMGWHAQLNLLGGKGGVGNEFIEKRGQINRGDVDGCKW